MMSLADYTAIEMKKFLHSMFGEILRTNNLKELSFISISSIRSRGAFDAARPVQGDKVRGSGKTSRVCGDDPIRAAPHVPSLGLAASVPPCLQT
jgi:hypothetical protein